MMLRIFSFENKENLFRFHISFFKKSLMNTGPIDEYWFFIGTLFCNIIVFTSKSTFSLPTFCNVPNDHINIIV